MSDACGLCFLLHLCLPLEFVDWPLEETSNLLIFRKLVCTTLKEKRPHGSNDDSLEGFHHVSPCVVVHIEDQNKVSILARYCCYKIVLIGNIVYEVFYFLNNVRSFKNCKLKQIL